MSTLTDKEKAFGEADLARKHFDICGEVSAERLRQNVEFCCSPIGVQRHNIYTWLAILGEEVGEVNQAVLNAWFSRGTGTLSTKKAREELIQVAAVAFALIERIDNQDPALQAPEGEYVNTIRP